MTGGGENSERSRQLLDSIIEGTPDHIFVKDLEGRYVLVNSACARAFHVPKSEIIGKNDFETLGPVFGVPLQTVDQRVISTGITEVVEETLMVEGHRRIFLSTKSAWRGGDGNIIGVIGVSRDITDRKRAEHELRESQNRLNLALEASQMGTWDYDIRRDLLEWSDGHYRLFGLEPGECTPTSELFTTRVHPEDRARVDEVVARAVARLEDFSVQYRAVWPNHSVHWLEARGRVVVEDGIAVRTIGVVADVTGRKQTEDKLRDAAKIESLGVLAGGVAHDFNNLLVGILGYASLIADCAEDPACEMAMHIVNAAQRAADLTRQMLAYSGKGRFVIQLMDLSNTVRQQEALLRSSIHRTVGLRLELTDGLPPIEGDRIQVEQLVMNLVINGSEACGEGPGTVTVATRLESGPYVCLEVRDTGCGMDEATQARVFDPFFSTKFTGRGLGLAAALGIVRGHNGIIRIASRPGQGSTFTVLFPAASVEAFRTAFG